MVWERCHAYVARRWPWADTTCLVDATCFVIFVAVLACAHCFARLVGGDAQTVLAIVTMVTAIASLFSLDHDDNSLCRYWHYVIAVISAFKIATVAPAWHDYGIHGSHLDLAWQFYFVFGHLYLALVKSVQFGALQSKLKVHAAESLKCKNQLRLSKKRNEQRARRDASVSLDAVLKDLGRLDRRRSLAELLSLEEHARRALEGIARAKETLTQQEEGRLCVICKQYSKNIAFMPCGHLCACRACGREEALRQCPLCREEILWIAERIEVFD